MKINQVEQTVGITKKNIRFYEEQGLLHPSRNLENGYRDYSDADIHVLFQIKLLRKLSVSIDDIRKLQGNRLSLNDCMLQHIIYLEHERENLSLIKEMCEELKNAELSLHTLDASVYLAKMQQLEEGGMRFMNIRKNDQKKKYGPILAAIVMIALMFAVIILLLWAATVDPIPFGLLLVFIAVPLTVACGVLLALRERFQEIEGGEEDEATKY